MSSWRNLFKVLADRKASFTENTLSERIKSKFFWTICQTEICIAFVGKSPSKHKYFTVLHSDPAAPQMYFPFFYPRSTSFILQGWKVGPVCRDSGYLSSPCPSSTPPPPQGLLNRSIYQPKGAAGTVWVFLCVNIIFKT